MLKKVKGPILVAAEFVTFGVIQGPLSLIREYLILVMVMLPFPRLLSTTV